MDILLGPSRLPPPASRTPHHHFHHFFIYSSSFVPLHFFFYTEQLKNSWCNTTTVGVYLFFL